MQFLKEGQNKLRYRVFPENIQNRKIIVFVDESVGNIPLSPKRLNEYYLTGRGTSKKRPEIVIEEFLDAVSSIDPNPYLALRLHPTSVATEYSQYNNEFDLISRTGSPLEWVFAADLIVGMTSMLLIEAALMGKPTLSIIPHFDEKEWLPTISAKITHCVTERDKIQPSIKKFLQKNSWNKQKINQNFIIADALKNITNFLEQCLNN